MKAAELDLALLAVVMGSFRDALVTHEAVINALNVFPVPDGDTGTNMRATVESVLDALAGAESDGRDNHEGELAAIASGSLFGARGNSGIILSQFLRGLTESLGAQPRTGPVELAQSFVAAGEAAHQAVTDPTPGTMLSVAIAAGASASASALAGGDLVAVIGAAYQGSVDALALTPAELPVLARAGVVDAGGAGLTLLFGAMLRELTQSDEPVALVLPDAVARALAEGPTDVPNLNTEANARPAESYEVMFLLAATAESIDRLRESWRTLGDSVAIVGSASLWNCHIHTADVGGAIEAAIEFGRPHKILVTDLNRQIAEEPWVLGSLGGRSGTTSEIAGEHVLEPRCAVVAISHGEGLRSILYSLGVAVIVDGGQLMNPSTREIVQALNDAGTPEVVLLPNNPNVAGVAREAAKHSLREVAVVATKDIQQAMVAMLHFDANRSCEFNAAAMESGLELAITGEITQAVRDAQSEAGAIKKGDFLGISSSTVLSIAPSLDRAACALIAKLLRPEHELLTLYSGAELTTAEVDQIVAVLAVSQPNLAVEHHVGGQWPQQLLVALE